MSGGWRPRAWRLPDGGTLVEGPAFEPLRGGELSPRTSHGEVLDEERNYYRLDPVGMLEESYGTSEWSAGDEMGVGTHRVEGDALMRLHSSYDCRFHEGRHGGSIVLEGLVPLPPEKEPSVKKVRALAAESLERTLAKGLQTHHSHWPERLR